jgi:glycosyltransferase involved in cell wall biosynthesis
MKAKICLSMIVKNEAQIITRALQSLLPVVSYYCICDTGSTDQTQQVIQNWFADHRLAGEVVSIPFDNFSQARNDALELANKVDYCDYLLFQDADMELQYTNLNWLENLTAPVYYLCQKNKEYSYYNIRLLRQGLQAKYVGVTHEYLECAQDTRAKLDIPSFYDHSDGKNRTQKTERDIQLLLRGLQKEPKNARYLFYLAQSYHDLQQYKSAAEYYWKRIATPGWIEETWYSFYRLGRILEKEQAPEEKILDAYISCYNLRPQRAEPLCRLATYYREKSHYHAGYMFAKMATETPFPTDILFVDVATYNYQAHDELAICAYYMGRYQESWDLCQSLCNNPLLPPQYLERIKQNQQFAAKKLKLAAEAVVSAR